MNERSTTGEQLYHSPIGVLYIEADGRSIVRISADGAGERHTPNTLTRQAAAQLDEYFAGERKSFDLPLMPMGTAFQRAVWEELRKIPYGCTLSYSELASRLGKPGAARAVGSAAGKNPILLLIPCHRLVAAKGIGGFSAGLEKKRLLLRHEGIKVVGINAKSGGNTENMRK